MIRISPDNPSSDDVITLTFTGGHGCPQPDTSRVNDDFIFHVEAHGGPCLSAPVPYTFHWTVGRIEAGDYTVVHSTDRGFSESAAFSVSQGIMSLGIPTLHPAGLLLMATVLVAAARFAVPRKRRATR